MTKLKVLSHACLSVTTDESRIVIDPWVVGSCYWRSWWNYPEVSIEDNEFNDVDAVAISHVHWDHWHGPSIKKYFSNVEFILGRDPNKRSVRDLKGIGVTQIREVAHGRSWTIGDITLTFYNFGLFLNDSAIVIETPDVTILNVNDAKLAGLPLRYVCNRHGEFDFVFRSHSSANSRVCFEVQNDASIEVDDREHYFRSFVAFVDAVNPKYAVPFASNHCHLTDDTMRFNAYVSKPTELREYFKKAHRKSSASFKLMIPGSTWSSLDGFDLVHQDVFENYEDKVSAYRDKNLPKLMKQQRLEEAFQLSPALMCKFEVFLRERKISLRSQEVRFLLLRGEKLPQAFLLKGKAVLPTTNISELAEKGVPLIVMPGVVFKDAVIKNMFHHAGISKRCRYIACDAEDLIALKSTIEALEMAELVGLERSYWLKLLAAYFRRWRDIWVYGLAIYYAKVHRLPLYKVEELILAKHS